MGAIPARKNDSARPFDGTAGRSNGNRTDWAFRSGRACAASLRCAVRCAPVQEIAETVSRALAYLTDRPIWPYCLPLMAERCLELHKEIAGAHEAYMRCAKRDAANLILSDLHDRLARLLGNSLLRERDHTPREMDHNFRCTGEIIPVQEWMAIAGMTQPLAQRCERNGSIVPK